MSKTSAQKLSEYANENLPDRVEELEESVSPSVGINNIADLKSMSVDAFEDGDVINVLGYFAAGDGGGGKFYWDADSTEDDNEGTIIQVTGVTTGRWKRPYSHRIDVRWFGAIPAQTPGNITDNTAALQNAIAALQEISTTVGVTQTGSAQILDFGSGIYGIDDTLSVTRYCQYRGSGAILRSLTAGEGTCFAGDFWLSIIHGLRFSGFDIALDLDNDNRNSGVVRISDCSFYENNQAFELRLQSSVVNIDNCKFRDNHKIGFVLSDKCTISGSWFSLGDETTALKHTHIDTIGLLIIDNCIGVPGFVTDDPNVEHAYVGMTGSGKVVIKDSRFGGENNPIPLINCDSQFNTPTYIVIRDTYAARAGNTSDTIPADKKIAGVRIMGHYPRAIYIGSGFHAAPGGYSLGFSSDIADITTLPATINTLNVRSCVPYIKIDSGVTAPAFNTSDQANLGLLASVTLNNVFVGERRATEGNESGRHVIHRYIGHLTLTTPRVIILGRYEAETRTRISGKIYSGRAGNFSDQNIIEISAIIEHGSVLSTNVKVTKTHDIGNVDLIQFDYDGATYIGIRFFNTTGSRYARDFYFSGYISSLDGNSTYPILIAASSASNISNYSNTTASTTENFTDITRFHGKSEHDQLVTFSPNGTAWRIDVDNSGNLSTTQL